MKTIVVLSLSLFLSFSLTGLSQVGYGDIGDKLEKLADLQLNASARIAKTFSDLNTKYTDIKFAQLELQIAELTEAVTSVKADLALFKQAFIFPLQEEVEELRKIIKLDKKEITILMNLKDCGCSRKAELP